MCQVLRDYQVEMLERLRQAWSGNENTRQQSVMVQMPTGTGKTYLMAEVVAHPQPHSCVPSVASQQSWSARAELAYP